MIMSPPLAHQGMLDPLDLLFDPDPEFSELPELPDPRGIKSLAMKMTAIKAMPINAHDPNFPKGFVSGLNGMVTSPKIFINASAKVKVR